MTIAAIDLVLRGATTSLLLLAAIVFARHGRSPAARYGAALNVAAILYLVTDSPLLSMGGATLPLLASAGTIALPLFWLFTRAWFDDDFAFGRREALIIGGFVIVRASYFLSAAPGGIPAATLAGPLSFAASLGFAGHALWTAWHGRDADLVEPRRRLRLGFIAAVGSFILWTLVSEGYARQSGNFTQWRTLNAGLLFALVLMLSAALLTLRRDDIFPVPADAPPEPDARPAADPRLAAALDRLMAHDRIYRTDGLTIGQLAARLDVPDYRLRQLINGALGYRNFNDYLNHHRLLEVKAALADPGQAEVPILTIAMDAGFGSLAPFNRAFRAATGRTPREYRARPE